MRKTLLAAIFTAIALSIQAQNYEMIVTTKGGIQYTIPAEDVISVEFGQAQETIGPIPSGIDISAVFNTSTIQAVLEQYDNIEILLSEGNYTISSDIVVPNHVRFAIRAEGEGANITMGDATLIVGNSFTLNNLTIKAANSTKPLVTLSSTPDESLIGATGSGSYYNIMRPFLIKNCKVESLSNVLLSDNGTNYCLGNMVVDNCTFELKSKDVSGKALVDMRNGGINDLTISNSTFYQKGPEDVKYLIQYNNGYRCDRAGYIRNSVSIISNTFYNVCYEGQIANYSGLAGRNTSDWKMVKNIFFNFSSGETARRFLGSRKDQPTATFDQNCYWYNGADENFDEYDTSGTVVTGDPEFVDAENNNFTPTSDTHVAAGIGDPRWLMVE